MGIPHTFASWWTFGTYLGFGYYKYRYEQSHIGLCVDMILFLLGRYLGAELLHDIIKFNFLLNCQTDLQGDCTI